MPETRNRVMAVRQTIILAAGNGSRLAGAHGVPKPLLTVGGLPLIEHALTHAAESGCVEAVIVIGHQGREVRSAVERLRPALNIQFVAVPDASLPNGVSLLAAEPFALRQFFLQMVDHVFTDPVLPKLLAAPLTSSEGGRVMVDRVPDAAIDLDDATKVRLEGDRIVSIGKHIEPWDAVDAGCFVLTHEVFQALRHVAPDHARTVSSGMRELANRGRLRAIDVSDVEWADVDTPADREAAERLLLQRQERMV
jgi:1L-myo-inositol 1-phosphate cytidylyltransferase